jgi:hypothetical protein
MPIGTVRRNLEGALISLAHIPRGKPRGITLRSNKKLKPAINNLLLVLKVF